MPHKKYVRFYDGTPEYRNGSDVTFSRNRPSGVVAEVRDAFANRRIEELKTALRYRDTPVKDIESEIESLERQCESRPVFHPAGALLYGERSDVSGAVYVTEEVSSQ